MSRLVHIVLFIVFSAFGLAQSLQAKQVPKSYPYNIVATVGMIGNVVSELVGDKAEVITLMGEGIDPHLYKPTRADMVKLSKADAIFYNGLMLEGKMVDALISVGRKKPVFQVTADVDEKKLLSPEDFGGHFDPHLWMDVTLWSEVMATITTSLIEFDPKNKDFYTANAKKYQEKLAKLGAYIKKGMATIPKSERMLITAHDAFNYFGRAYDLEVMGIQGISTESEAGLRDIRSLVDLIVKRNVKAVFVESSVSTKNIKALIEGCKAKGHTVIIGGELFSDAMGTAGSYEGTYHGMLDHNATTVIRALGGEAPEKGLLGKLSHHAH